MSPAAGSRHGLRAWLAQHLAIVRQFARIGVRRKSQFRLDFLNQVLMDICFYALHVLTFEVLFLHTDTLAGWSPGETRVFLGFLFLSDAFSMIWLGQSWMFGEDLKNGNLDLVRVRPAAPIVVYFFQRFSLEAVINMFFALSYWVFALASADISWSVERVLLCMWAVALAWWVRVVIVVLFSIGELWVLNSNLSQLLHHVSMEISDRPLDILPKRLRQFLLYAVPSGALAWYPAQVALSRTSVLAAALHSLFFVGLGLAVFRAWRASFKRYESAMS